MREISLSAPQLKVVRKVLESLDPQVYLSERALFDHSRRVYLEFSKGSGSRPPKIIEVPISVDVMDGRNETAISSMLRLPIYNLDFFDWERDAPAKFVSCFRDLNIRGEMETGDYGREVVWRIEATREGYSLDYICGFSSLYLQTGPALSANGKHIALARFAANLDLAETELEDRFEDLVTSENAKAPVRGRVNLGEVKDLILQAAGNVFDRFTTHEDCFLHVPGILMLKDVSERDFIRAAKELLEADKLVSLSPRMGSQARVEKGHFCINGEGLALFRIKRFSLPVRLRDRGLVEAADFLESAERLSKSSRPADWNACKANCRNALDSALSGLAGKGDVDSSLSILKERDFLGDTEVRLIKVLRGVTSDKGTHPPVSPEADVRWVLEMTRTTLGFLLDRCR